MLFGSSTTRRELASTTRVDFTAYVNMANVLCCLLFRVYHDAVRCSCYNKPFDVNSGLSLTWVLMPWWCKQHQQPCYGLHEMGIFLSFLRGNLNYLYIFFREDIFAFYIIAGHWNVSSDDVNCKYTFPQKYFSWWIVQNKKYWLKMQVLNNLLILCIIILSYNSMGQYMSMCHIPHNKANLRDLIAATSLVILLKIGLKSSIFPSMWPSNLMDDLKKQYGTSSVLHQVFCIISNPLVNSNCSYSPETLNLGQNWQFSVLCDLEIWWMTLKNNRAPLLCYFKLCKLF